MSNAGIGKCQIIHNIQNPSNLEDKDKGYGCTLIYNCLLLREQRFTPRSWDDICVIRMTTEKTRSNDEDIKLLLEDQKLAGVLWNLSWLWVWFRGCKCAAYLLWRYPCWWVLIRGQEHHRELVVIIRNFLIHCFRKHLKKEKYIGLKDCS